MEETTEKQMRKDRFDISYAKFTKFFKGKISRKKLAKFMKANPGLVIYVSKEKVKRAHEKYDEYLKTRPLAAKTFAAEKQVILRADED